MTWFESMVGVVAVGGRDPNAYLDPKPLTHDPFETQSVLLKPNDPKFVSLFWAVGVLGGSGYFVTHYKYSYNPHKLLKCPNRVILGVISTVIIGLRSTMNLQVEFLGSARGISGPIIWISNKEWPW